MLIIEQTGNKHDPGKPNSKLSFGSDPQSPTEKIWGFFVSIQHNSVYSVKNYPGSRDPGPIAPVSQLSIVGARNSNDISNGTSDERCGDRYPLFKNSSFLLFRQVKDIPTADSADEEVA